MKLPHCSQTCSEACCCWLWHQEAADYDDNHWWSRVCWHSGWGSTPRAAPQRIYPVLWHCCLQQDIESRSIRLLLLYHRYWDWLFWKHFHLSHLVTPLTEMLLVLFLSECPGLEYLLPLNSWMNCWAVCNGETPVMWSKIQSSFLFCLCDFNLLTYWFQYPITELI